jgi:hypothetical protein
VDGDGINMTNLNLKLNIGENELSGYIEELEMESKIYRSEGDTYQTY